MRRLLLDENFSPAVAEALRLLVPELDVAVVLTWYNRRFVGTPDPELLEAAAKEERILVTFDVNTIPGFLAQMAEAQKEHSGVIFCSTKSYSQNDYGAWARALASFLERHGAGDWKNRAVFLPKI